MPYVDDVDTLPDMPRRTSHPADLPDRPRDDHLLTLSDCADILGLSYFTVARSAASGTFCPAARKLPNGQWRVRYRDLMDWVLSGDAS